MDPGVEGSPILGLHERSNARHGFISTGDRRHVLQLEALHVCLQADGSCCSVCPDDAV